MAEQGSWIPRKALGMDLPTGHVHAHHYARSEPPPQYHRPVKRRVLSNASSASASGRERGPIPQTPHLRAQQQEFPREVGQLFGMFPPRPPSSSQLVKTFSKFSSYFGSESGTSERSPGPCVSLSRKPYRASDPESQKTPKSDRNKMSTFQNFRESSQEYQENMWISGGSRTCLPSLRLTVRVKFLSAVLLHLRIFFPKITVTITVLKFEFE